MLISPGAAGFVATIKVELEKEKVDFYAGFTRGTVINPNYYIADRDMYTLGVEAQHDIL